MGLGGSSSSGGGSGGSSSCTSTSSADPPSWRVYQDAEDHRVGTAILGQYGFSFPKCFNKLHVGKGFEGHWDEFNRMVGEKVREAQEHRPHDKMKLHGEARTWKFHSEFHFCPGPWARGPGPGAWGPGPGPRGPGARARGNEIGIPPPILM